MESDRPSKSGGSLQRTPRCFSKGNRELIIQVEMKSKNVKIELIGQTLSGYLMVVNIEHTVVYSNLPAPIRFVITKGWSLNETWKLTFEQMEMLEKPTGSGLLLEDFVTRRRLVERHARGMPLPKLQGLK